ncbi:MAG: TRAP-type C4-dicarboxylate transport system, small permease component [Candidatus Krumholzibacteriota bacterium]|nr:TRAP-type C4-dicarboxylate transport system, small permease component [Candidatus Krumholzibacteriota bacterium]
MERSTLTFIVVILGIVAAAIVRAYLDKTGRLRGLFKFLGRVEIGIIALLLLSLVFFGCLQIVLRNFFHRGIIWADPMMRHLVLWLGCLGGVYATSKMRHISIDFLTRFLPKKAKRIRDRIVYLATAVATALLGYAALRLVLEEKSYGEKEFLNIDTWVLQAILPVAFLIISYRCVVNSIRPPDVQPIDWEGTTSREES